MTPPRDNYEAMKESARARNAEISESGRDIGKLPPVANPERKERAREDFRFFCESYFPMTFELAWSADHLKVISKIEQAVLRGGLFAMAMPRGTGKTTLCECACIWAVLYGHRESVGLIGSTETGATGMLDSVKTELDSNELLGEDFPEVCYPIERLEGITNRCAGQLYKGERTHIHWTAKGIVLPTIPGSSASGAIVKVAGLTGHIRGLKHKRRDGRTVRPSLVIIDDPQTDESARSLSQCVTRESILAGAILGLAGPGQKIAGCMPCTVIRPGDMADNILDREKHPQWQGERTKMVYSFPSNEKLWEEYALLRAEGLRAGQGLRDATEFYGKNRAAMDEGAEVAWPERYNHDELSAIQHAMNLRLQDERAFFAEYQNEPLPEEDEAEQLEADTVEQKQNSYKRGQVPADVRWLTSYVDVHDNLLYWMVCGWSEKFDGYIIDYGAHPEQKLAYFTLRGARPTMRQKYPGRGKEGAIYAGLVSLVDGMAERQWQTDANEYLQISKMPIDTGYVGLLVEQAIRVCKRRGALVPSKGIGVKAVGKLFSEYKKRRGDRAGDHWRMPVPLAGHLRQLQIDTNYWKSFARNRLTTPPGVGGCVSIFKARSHRLLAEHFSAEKFARVEAKGRTVEEWSNPKNLDNHWWDCFVGNCVAASMCGAVLVGVKKKQRSKTPIKLSELQAKRRAQGR